MAEHVVDASVNGIAIWAYHFTEVGDVLELHQHKFSHQTKVIAGSFKVLGRHGNGLVLTPESDALLVPSGIEHGYEALEAGSRLLNISDSTQPGFIKCRC